MKHVCNKCNLAITDKEYVYSKKYFFKPLCIKCQPTNEAKELGHLLKEEYKWDIEFESGDGWKSVDIAIKSQNVHIEVDGSQHIGKEQAIRDLMRTFYSWRDGFVTIRIPNSLVRDSKTLKKTAEFLDKFLRDCEEEDYQYNKSWFDIF